MNLGAPELLIVLVIALLLFGGKKLPDLARSLGQAKKEFETGNAESEAKAAEARAEAAESDRRVAEQRELAELRAAEKSRQGVVPPARSADESASSN